METISSNPVNSDYIRGGKQKSVYSAQEVTRWSCPLCGKQDESKIKTERGVLNVVECASCSLIRINPRLEHPDEVYRGKTDVYREEFRLVVSGKKPHHRDGNYRHDLEIIKKYKPTGKFLDIGTNTGSFLRLARGQGWELTGVEPSPQLGALAREWWGLNILEGFIEKLALPASNFDIVTMTDVFEHVVNPREVLSAIHKTMKPEGVLFVKVPNGRYNLLKYKIRSMLGRKDSDDFDAYEHVCHYTHRTLRAMIETEGFEVLKIWVEEPVQIPVWHHYVGHYYQHASPYSLAWKTYLARDVLYQAARVETLLTGRVGWLAPNIGCIARKKRG